MPTTKPSILDTPYVPRTDTRKNRVRDRHRISGPREFIGIDGEGENTPDGNHIYTLLASSKDYLCIQNQDGLNYEQCFNFILWLHEQYPKHVIVGFSFNYDITMMLKTLPRKTVAELWIKQRVKYRDGLVTWYLEWIPSKTFRITKVQGTRKQSVQVYDCFGFFQMSFVKAIKEWGIADKTTCDRILAMKDKRGDFANVSEHDIRRYCFEECEYLEKLMDKLADAFVRAEIPLAQYHGAGAAAAGLLRKHRVQQHIKAYPHLDTVFLSAYFGGRSELFRVGPYDVVFNADINSAYPYSSTFLPTMHGEWKYSALYNPWAEYAIWNVSWDIGNTAPLAPFPFRDVDGSILYLRSGSGWYHAVEVTAAIKLYGTQIQVHGGHIFTPSSDVKPFAFIEPIYTERQKRKQAGDVSQLPMKLSINAVYGKLAQGFGYRDKAPAYQCYYWAGYITAKTRAMILEACYPIRHDLIAISTDGIFALKPPTVRESKKLGDWEGKTLYDFFSAQAGVYQCTTVGEVPISRNRGFSTREIDWGALRRKYARDGLGASVTYSPTRFLTIGGAAPSFRDFGVWKQRKRHLSITSGKKWPGDDDKAVLTIGTSDESISTPYVKKRSWTDFEDLDAFLAELEEW